VLNLVAAESAEARGAIADLSGRLLSMPRRHELIAVVDVNPRYLNTVLERTYEQPPEDFEALLGVQGLGPKTLRALALVAELVYGTTASTRDPARFAFAHGGKDGTPHPVDRGTYDATIEAMNTALNGATLERSDRVAALKRLARLASTPAAPPSHDRP
jgi:hypothetical protein